MRVLPDTNVLFSVRLINLLMRSHAAGIVDVVWSDHLLSEFERVMIEKKGISPLAAAGVANRIKLYAPRGRIDPNAYIGKLSEMTAPDVDDHVHAAAASVGADILLTDNTGDYSPAEVAPCRIATPRVLFGELAETFSMEFARILEETSRVLVRPQRTQHELIDDLAAIGLIRFAELVRDAARRS